MVMWVPWLSWERKHMFYPFLCLLQCSIHSLRKRFLILGDMKIWEFEDFCYDLQTFKDYYFGWFCTPHIDCLRQKWNLPLLITYCWKFFWNKDLVVKTVDNIVIKGYCSRFLSIGYLAEFINLFNLTGNKYLGQSFLFICYSDACSRKGNIDILLGGFYEVFVVLWLQPSWLIKGKYYYWQFYG